VLCNELCAFVQTLQHLRDTALAMAENVGLTFTQSLYHVPSLCVYGGTLQLCLSLSLSLCLPLNIKETSNQISMVLFYWCTYAKHLYNGFI